MSTGYNDGYDIRRAMRNSIGRWPRNFGTPRRSSARRIGRRDGTIYEQLCDHEVLLEAFDDCRAFGGQAPGADGLTYDDLSRPEAAACLRHVARQIRDGTYRPQPTRAVQIPRRVGFRTLQLPSILDRAVARALVNRLTPVFDPVFSPRSYGFRPALGIWHLLADFVQLLESRDRWVIVHADIRDAFPSVPIADALERFARYVGDAQLLHLIEAVLRGHDSARTIGIDQGNALSPMTLNVVLHHRHDLLIDTVLSDSPSSAGAAPPLWLRYADDIVYLCQSVSAGRGLINSVTELLAPAGFSLRPNIQPVSLTRPGAHVDLLGFRILWNSGRVILDMGRDAYRSLADSLAIAHTRPHSVAVAGAVLRGWVTAQGPACEIARRASVLARIRQVVIDVGLREIYEPDEINRWMGNAHTRWRQLLDSRRLEQRPG